MTEDPAQLFAPLMLGLALLVGMSLAAYLVLINVSSRRARVALWCILAACFLLAPVAAVTRGGWWWLAPGLAAASVGLLGAAQRAG